MNANDDIRGEVFRQGDEIIARKIAGETVLVPIRGKLADMQRIFALDGVGEYIWQELDGKKSLGEIRNRIVSRFDVGEGQAETDLREFIVELLDAGLIVRKG